MKSAWAFISYYVKSGCSKRKNVLKLWDISGNGQYYANVMLNVQTSHYNLTIRWSCTIIVRDLKRL